ncbi:hypothetical protein KO481_01280 [Nocardia sp. NEAU-G5]|uniref:Uncharacterized protein n=1 Tax=Nocardia albiluteola TaxID=2842303 RepID=A0ABS6ATB6_9NOCA|nr:hypothetical protein [Nocardia albiluteola]MBU3060160.1 hypothetical protein [Nocardia albiluteola]
MVLPTDKPVNRTARMGHGGDGRSARGLWAHTPVQRCPGHSSTSLALGSAATEGAVLMVPSLRSVTAPPR